MPISVYEEGLCSHLFPCAAACAAAVCPSASHSAAPPRCQLSILNRLVSIASIATAATQTLKAAEGRTANPSHTPSKAFELTPHSLY